jgi:hypothetical protein
LENFRNVNFRSPANSIHPDRCGEIHRGQCHSLVRDTDFSQADYAAAMKSGGSVGARGGAFFDVLHLQAARIAKSDEILTLNERHFITFAPDLAAIIRQPQ